MTTYPYPTTLRSTTPPLYYHRPEGSAPSYYTVPTHPLDGLRIPPPNDGGVQPAATAHPRLSATTALPYQSGDRNSVQRPPPPPSPRLSAGYAMPTVVNPYGPTASRWSTAQPPVPSYPTVDPLTSRVAALEAEESAAAAEEASLRSALAELQATRRRQAEEQLRLSRGWAEMLEREERYYTEPLVDRRPDIAAREQQCAMLHDRLQQAEAQALHVQAQLQSTDYILREAESVEQERTRVQDGFRNIERRRRECVAKAERYFDVEAKRVVEGNKAIRKLDVQLREMTCRGPLAQLQQQQQQQRSSSSQPASSRTVTFATDKSIVLDLGREESAEPLTGESGGGMTNSYGSTSNSAGDFMGLNEEDIGGTSIAFSFNDAKDALLAKRRKTEIISA